MKVRRQVAVRAGFVAAALAAALVPLPAPAVERLYSNGVYLAIQPFLTSASNRTAFAWLDVFIAAMLLLVVVDIARGAGRNWTGIALESVGRAVTWAAAVYLVFLLGWGLNYRRVRLIDRLQFERAAVTDTSAANFAIGAATELKNLHGPAHRAGWRAAGEPGTALASSFEATLRHLRVGRAVVVGRPKRTLLDRYFSLAGVDGMTDPFFLETLVATDLLPFERPFVVAHEWSHLAGFADEGDANFVGWLACLHGETSDQYSGWLFLYGQVAAALPDRDRATVADALASGPRADLREVAARLQRQISPRVAAAGWRAYDRFLKANRVEAGAASYAQVVQLALGVRFADGWVPEFR